MSERTEVSFDAALMMALRADAQKELDELPSPAQLKERYPDTSRWDARLQAALHKRRPVLKRVLIAVLTLVILTLGALAVSAEFRRAVYTMIQKFLPIEMQLTYQVDGEPLEKLPNGYSDHYVPDGFERDYEQGYDNEISFLHAYVDANDKSIFYYVDCSVIQDYGQIETFDNEHTVYERIKVGTADATLGTNNSGGRTGYVLVWEKDPLQPKNRKAIYLNSTNGILACMTFLYSEEELGKRMLTIDSLPAEAVATFQKEDDINIQETYEMVLEDQHCIVLLKFISTESLQSNQEQAVTRYRASVIDFFEEYTQFLKSQENIE